MPQPSFTERDVEEFFDGSTETYLSFWDPGGVLHTGYFAHDNDADYRAAAEATSRLVADEAAIAPSSVVLDAGCGCGNFAIYLARRFGCRCDGLDLSQQRIAVADAQLAGDPRLAGLVSFRHGSVTRMPYPDRAFSHVVSQDALFLVPDKAHSHAEIHRVLRPGGTFALSDFLQPRCEVSPRARKHVYDRVRWSSGYSLVGYQAALEAAGFQIRLARDLSPHLKKTYAVLGVVARDRAEAAPSRAAADWMRAFSASCHEIGAAIDDGEFGWGLIVAERPAARTNP
ncbi:MAG TPA: methyltransferase domain-containing protein [Kofleriaceae bacterium]|nr:methyltransferase domain-containing protein [Kofleriaceae bacterium]